MYKSERGMADKTAIFIGIVLILFIIGFFRTDGGLFGKYNAKSLLQMPCGLTLSDISDNDKIKFPLVINGYVNGCGWDADGKNAGTVQVFDNAGRLISSPAQIFVNEDGVNLPLSIQSTVYLNQVPQTETGKVLIRSYSGFTKIIPVSF